MTQVILYVVYLIWEFMVNPFRWLFGVGNCRSTARLDGKVAVVTGANSGIGKATAHLLAERGAKVIMASRDVKKSEEARKSILEQVPEAQLVVMQLDLSSLASVRRFASTFLETQKTIDILVNNAGVFMVPYSLTEDGFEINLGINYLGHFLLTMLLLDKIKKSSDARIINATSLNHLDGHIDFDDITLENHYNRFRAYNRSQLCRVLFTRELSRRLGIDSQVKTYAVAPGVVSTEITREINEIFGNNRLFGLFLEAVQFFFFRTPRQGAQTNLHCAVDPQAGCETGLYYNDSRPSKPGNNALDDETAERLWDLSWSLVGLNNNYLHVV